jgi:transcriptional regulator with XRE-family HTH domain
VGPVKRREPVQAAFGDRVKAIRDRLGVTQEALAERAGLHRTYVGSIERGERNLSLRNIVRLAGALGVDPAELMAGLGAAPRP